MDLRELVISSCKICDGSGVLNNERCSCRGIYNILVSMQIGNFPDEVLLKLYNETLLSEFELCDDDLYYNRILTDPDFFVSNGCGLVIYGVGTMKAASYLVYKILEHDSSLDCGYQDEHTKISVFDLSFPSGLEQLARVIKSRVLKLLPTILLVNLLDVFDSNKSLADAVRWGYGMGLNGEVFRGVNVIEKIGISRWK